MWLVASLVAVYSSSFVETLHIFGQLQYCFATDALYAWNIPVDKTGQYKYLFRALSLLAVTITSHHHSYFRDDIFYFSINWNGNNGCFREKVNSYKRLSSNFFYKPFSVIQRIVLLAVLPCFLIIFCIFPYWMNSKRSITQVPIPWRWDNFIEVTSSGLMFCNSMGIFFLFYPTFSIVISAKDTFVLAFQLPYLLF
jgi:hypothetical protein